MKEVTTDNFSFESLRNGNVLYVDKTQYVWKLVNSKTNIYFLSHPHRFGKSLLISTLEAFFLNKRELFRGLAIDSLAPNDVWQEWPVIHLDMALSTMATSYEDREKMLVAYIADVARSFGVTADETETAPTIFRRLIINYWFATGTPTFLVKQMRNDPFLLEEFSHEWMSPIVMDKYDATNLSPAALALQTGYLTIADVTCDDFGESCRYDFPNEEIRMSWNDCMLDLASTNYMQLSGGRRKLYNALCDGNVDMIIND